ncbi:MAG: hypothetical protein EHM36_03300, partial [Deltaproteobacteria bacterium]
MKGRQGFCLIVFSFLLLLNRDLNGLGGSSLCCPDDPEISYLLSPGSTQKFQYRVQYGTFFSTLLGKEKGYFLVFPEGFDQDAGQRYPLLFFLHGYNFHRNGFWWKVRPPEAAKRILCKVKEEEYHWLLHEDIAVIAYAVMDPRNLSYRDLEKSLEDRFEELSRHGGLAKGDYTPREIAQSIVSHNLHPGSLDAPWLPAQKMIIALPDGDNGFYTDENEGRSLFPETKDRGSCDGF